MIKIIVPLLSGKIIHVGGTGKKIQITVKGPVRQYLPKFVITCDEESAKLIFEVLKTKLNSNTLNSLYNKKISVSLD